LLAELDRVELEQSWDQQRAREWWETHMAAPAAECVVTDQPMLAVR
jgi:hypothetical protein